MPLYDSQIMTLFSWELFRKMANNQAIPLYQFNMITNVLVENNIPYDVSFTSGTRSTAAALELTIHINPSASLTYVVSLEPGASSFASG